MSYKSSPIKICLWKCSCENVKILVCFTSRERRVVDLYFLSLMALASFNCFLNVEKKLCISWASSPLRFWLDHKHKLHIIACANSAELPETVIEIGSSLLSNNNLLLNFEWTVTLSCTNLNKTFFFQDMYVFVSEQEKFTNFNDEKSLFWLEEELSYGDWLSGIKGDGSYEKHGKLPISEVIHFML